MTTPFVQRRIESASQLAQLELRKERDAIRTLRADLHLRQKELDREEKILDLRQIENIKAAQKECRREFGDSEIILKPKRATSLTEAGKRLNGKKAGAAILDAIKKASSEGIHCVELAAQFPNITVRCRGDRLKILKDKGSIRQEGSARNARYYYHI